MSSSAGVEDTPVVYDRHVDAVLTRRLPLLVASRVDSERFSVIF